MRKFHLTAILLLLSTYITPSYASNSVSLNYAIGTEKDAETMHGFNVMFKHNINGYALIASGTYIQNTAGNEYGYLKNKYASIMPGLAFNVTPALSLYGLAGLACWSKMKTNQNHEIYGTALGFGLFYNVTDNIQLNSGYELGIVNSKEIDTFVLGMGYLF